MLETGYSRLVHWDVPEGWDGEGGSGWGTHVHPRLIHVNVWQKPLQYCKVISLQLKTPFLAKKKKRKSRRCSWVTLNGESFEGFTNVKIIPFQRLYWRSKTCLGQSWVCLQASVSFQQNYVSHYLLACILAKIIVIKKVNILLCPLDFIFRPLVYSPSSQQKNSSQEQHDVSKQLARLLPTKAFCFT